MKQTHANTTGSPFWKVCEILKRSFWTDVEHTQFQSVEESFSKKNKIYLSILFATGPQEVKATSLMGLPRFSTPFWRVGKMAEVNNMCKEIQCQILLTKL